ncbi:transcriptional regulator [Mycobacterium intermedium]|uniref:Transcriptional regulator n=1 Tax=Mycobacterium intermedium TaxID=28445 RepID=A0A1E3S585_MYCIE|nr:helix-turn-helix domain-containing protein [Mycobacterium intermedium]MCV6964150.1 helix-turn-helix domain-containing protein [Mycobacterium intermedium]ODQ97335.1 transcriptional regulator [Mycobacterium intermedium]OPE46067.1 transcriptional regulator [Mycobacterium intermedium]ORA93987.1 transcriptional regulator [Mycobacterium intermedium]
MRGTTSAPTTRVVDVVELLSRSGERKWRFSDIARELGLNQATAHAILKTLTDRGWITRDPATKVFALGPALALIAAQLDHARPTALVGREAARRLVATTEMPASVVERAGEDLVLTAFERPADSVVVAPIHERIPYTPPFGVAFAAWDNEESQQAWVQCGAADDATLAQRLRDVLAETRARGYDIDWLTPALAQAAQVLGTLSAVPTGVRPIIDRLRVEFTAAGIDPDAATHDHAPIATISAPVLDRDRQIQFALAVHPLRPMSAAEIQATAAALLAEIERIS